MMILDYSECNSTSFVAIRVELDEARPSFRPPRLHLENFTRVIRENLIYKSAISRDFFFAGKRNTLLCFNLVHVDLVPVHAEISTEMCKGAHFIGYLNN